MFPDLINNFMRPTRVVEYVVRAQVSSSKVHNVFVNVQPCCVVPPGFRMIWSCAEENLRYFCYFVKVEKQSFFFPKMSYYLIRQISILHLSMWRNYPKFSPIPFLFFYLPNIIFGLIAKFSGALKYYISGSRSTAELF